MVLICLKSKFQSEKVNLWGITKPLINLLLCHLIKAQDWQIFDKQKEFINMGDEGRVQNVTTETKGCGLRRRGPMDDGGCGG